MTECKHGLRENECDACRPLGNESAEAAGPLGGFARTVARYAGKCLACGEAISVGDALVRTPDDIWVHEGCED